MILKHDIEAKIGDFPKNIFSLLANDKLAEEEIYYWTPYPKTFGYILPLSKQLNILIRNKKSFTSEADYQSEVNNIKTSLTKKRHECSACSKPTLTRHSSGRAGKARPAA
ncbi:MAG: hypothetical protein O2999_04905 [Nitrospirae bacterium]|nr:hypothetical protein [Nitrospirota bacterium]